MREIGVRELKRSLSEILRAVERGAHVRVTVRGRAAADIVPAGAAPGNERVRALVAEGRSTAPVAALPKRAPSATDLALAHQLRSLDALHLAAAVLLPGDELTIGTWDRRLHAAAGAEGVRAYPATL